MKQIDSPAPESPGIIRVDPDDGATGVFRDAPVALRANQPVDPGSIGPEALRVQDSEGPVPGRVRLSPDRRVLIFCPERPFQPGRLHFVVALGLRDARGRLLEPHWSRFVPCDLGREDLAIEA
jgi:hypothetical protein